MTRSSRKRRVGVRPYIVAVWVIVVIFAMIYGGRLFWLGLESSDGAAAPSASAMNFPDGTAVLRSEKLCGSGGCWTRFIVKPSAASAADFEERYLTRKGRISGTFWDPREVHFSTEKLRSTYRVSAEYWRGSTD